MALSIKATVIQSFAKFILGAGTFERVKGVVLRMDDKDLSGAEKRILALEEIKLLGLSIAAWMINLSIELAVSYFRTLSEGKPGEKDGNK